MTVPMSLNRNPRLAANAGSGSSGPTGSAVQNNGDAAQSPANPTVSRTVLGPTKGQTR